MTEGAPFPPQLEIAAGVLDGIESHAYSNLFAEVGGMLVGQIADGVTHIFGSVPALSAAADQVSLTFTHEVWDEILKTVDAEFPGSAIVGWYHTHPSFGLFLSQYDEFIQRNFFANPGQVALVVDPIAGTLAWFTQNGADIAKFGEQSTGRGARSRPGEAGHSALRGGVSRKRAALFAAGAALLSTAVVWGIGASTAAPDVRAALVEKSAVNSELTQQYSALTQQIAGVLENPVLVYTVAKGDTFTSIAERFYGSDDIRLLLSANFLDADAVLQVGQKVLLPHVPGVAVWPHHSSPSMPSFTPVAPTPLPTPSPSGPSEPPTPPTPTAPAPSTSPPATS